VVDRATFDDVFRAEYPGIVRVVAPIIGSTADAEGIVQDAFVKAYARWGRIGRYDRPGAWVRRVAIRDAVRLAERNRRVSPAPTPDDAVERIADRVDLLDAVALLAPRQRAAVVLHHLADWPVRDVADALGCAETTVRVHLHRGRTALAELLRVDSEEAVDGP
jgi:RNA polymerase sigma-70 factor (ECF subfamily)